MYNLQGIEIFCGKSPGGLKSVQYAPVDWIDESSFEMILNGYNWQKAIQFLQGDWLSVHLFTKQRIWEETFNGDEQGGYYDDVVGGFLPFHNAALAQELDAMRRKGFVLKVTDRADQVFLLGNPDSPMLFSSEGTTNADLGNIRGHNVSWNGRGRQMKFTYNPQW